MRKKFHFHVAIRTVFCLLSRKTRPANRPRMISSRFHTCVELRALTWAATLFRPAKYERTNSRTPMDTWNWFNSSADLYDTLVGIPVTLFLTLD